MKRLIIGLCLSILLPLTGNAAVAGVKYTRIGLLSCTTVPHSSINLLIHSTKQVRCEFSPSGSKRVEHYKGETGIGFGLDVSIVPRDNTRYAVLANRPKPGAYQLAGKYEGAVGGINLGLSIGNGTAIQNSDSSIILQRVEMGKNGINATAGFTYLYLQADKR